jgi:hypothetical protein
MARPRSKGKREHDGKQLPLPPSPRPALPATRVLPMQLRLGDRIVDETGEWEVIGRMYMTNAGKTTHVRVRRVDQPDVTQIRTWGAHERISVNRATAEGNR